jgi:hypothetical protein
MNNKVKIGLGIAGTVVAIGAAVGVGAAAAGLASGTQEAGTQVGGYGQGVGGQGEGGDGQSRGGFDSTELAKSLATKLGVAQDKVEAALKEVMEANQPSGAASAPPSGQASGQPSAMPSGQASGQPDGQGGPGGGGGADLETMAKSLAEKLNLDEATVLAALQEVMGSQGGGSQPSASATSQ